MLSPETIRKALSHGYPACFKPKGARKLPLKIGIHHDILARHPGLSMEEIRAGLKDYTDGPKYLEQCVEGADRVDLDGKPVAKVTRWEEDFSRRRLASLRAEWSKPAPTLGDILSAALSRAKEESMNVHSPLISNTAPGALPPGSFVESVALLIRRGEISEATRMIAARDKAFTDFGVSEERRRSGVSAALDRIADHMRGSRKIEAIKEVRSLSGKGLKEAKDWVESWMGQTQASTPTYQHDGFIVATKHADELFIRSEHDYLDSATASATRVAAEHNIETLLLRVIGKTKRTFALIP